MLCGEKPRARADRDQKSATAENRTRINCLEGNYANHYTTVAARSPVPRKSCLESAAVAQAPCTCVMGTFLQEHALVPPPHVSRSGGASTGPYFVEKLQCVHLAPRG